MSRLLSSRAGRAWIAVAVVLAVVPAALTLTRSPDYSAAAELQQATVRRVAPIGRGFLWNRFLASPYVARRLKDAVGARPAEYRGAELDELSDDRLRVTVTARDPRRATELADAMAAELLDASKRRVLELRPRARSVRSGFLGPPARLTAPLEGTDAVLDALPGEPPGRPSPAWTAVAGLMCAAFLWIILALAREPR